MLKAEVLHTPQALSRENLLSISALRKAGSRGASAMSFSKARGMMMEWDIVKVGKFLRWVVMGLKLVEIVWCVVAVDFSVWV